MTATPRATQLDEHRPVGAGRMDVHPAQARRAAQRVVEALRRRQHLVLGGQAGDVARDEGDVARRRARSSARRPARAAAPSSARAMAAPSTRRRARDSRMRSGAGAPVTPAVAPDSRTMTLPLLVFLLHELAELLPACRRPGRRLRGSSAPPATAATLVDRLVQCARSTGSGVPLGAKKPNHEPASKPGKPLSATVGTSGMRARALGAGHRDARAACRPGCAGSTDGMVANMNCMRPASRSLSASAPLYGTCAASAPDALAQHVAGQVRRRADAGRAVVELAGIGLGVGDELVERLRRQRGMHHQHVGHVGDLHDRHQVDQRVVCRASCTASG